MHAWPRPGGRHAGERLVLAVAALERPGDTAEGLARAAWLQERVVGEVPWPDPSEGVGTVAMYSTPAAPTAPASSPTPSSRAPARLARPARGRAVAAAEPSSSTWARSTRRRPHARRARRPRALLGFPAPVGGIGQLALVLAERGALGDADALLAEHGLGAPCPSRWSSTRCSPARGRAAGAELPGGGRRRARARPPARALGPAPARARTGARIAAEALRAATAGGRAQLAGQSLSLAARGARRRRSRGAARAGPGDPGDRARRARRGRLALRRHALALEPARVRGDPALSCGAPGRRAAREQLAAAWTVRTPAGLAGSPSAPPASCARHRRPPPPARSSGRDALTAGRAPRRRPRGRGEQPRDRPGAVRHRRDGRDPPPPRLPQAGRRRPRRPGGRAGAEQTRLRRLDRAAAFCAGACPTPVPRSSHAIDSSWPARRLGRRGCRRWPG